MRRLQMQVSRFSWMNKLKRFASTANKEIDADFKPQSKQNLSGNGLELFLPIT